MAFAVLTVGADGNIYIYIYIFQIFIVWLCLLRDYGFIPSCVERLYVVVLQSHLQNLIEVQDGFDCVANLEILKIIHWTFLAMRKRLSLLCSFFFTEDFSVEVSVDDLLETTCYCRIKNLEVCLQLDPDD